MILEDWHKYAKKTHKNTGRCQTIKRRKKEYKQFTKINPFISLHVLNYNVSRAAPPQVYGCVYSLYVQAVTLGVGKMQVICDKILWLIHTFIGLK